MSTVIKVENISKQYRLGLIGTNTLKGDLQRWWYNLRGLPDPTLMIGQENILSAGKRTANERPEEFVWALRDINFEVRQGEILGIIGKNGAGKSTLLKLLSRVTAPTTGNIKVKGRIASLLEVGTGFHPELTGRENIFLNGAILGMTKPEIHSKFDEIVDFAGVNKYIDTTVKRYSSGMFVRLAFAVAAHLEPEILIVDEVLAVGDVEFQKKAIGKMQDVSLNEGRTVLFVSHNMGMIRKLCKTSILLNNGSIILNSDTETVLGSYLSENSQTTYKRNWFDNFPQIQNVRIKQVKIINEKRDNISNLFTNTTFFVAIKYEILEKTQGCGFTLVIYDNEERCIFGSINNKIDSFYGKVIEIGEYLSSCEIPANLLNNGVYKISIIVFSYGYRNSIELSNLLKFEIHDSYELRNDFNGKYEGCLRPNLLWGDLKIS